MASYTWLYLKKKKKKDSIGMLEKRKSAFGFDMILFTLMETRNIALGGI